MVIPTKRFLHKLGGYSKRVEETLELIDQGAPVSNLEWQNVTEKTALLRLREMSYDSESDESADFSQMREELTASLSALKNRASRTLSSICALMAAAPAIM